MQINYAEWICPQCKTKNREACNTWMYGTPIRDCKACRSEYLDRRWREVAIDGFDPRSNNAQFYVKVALVFLAIALVCSVMIYFQYAKGFYSTKIIAIGAGSTLLGITCLIMSIRIKLGFQNKDNDKYMAESKARLQDPQYIEKLRKFGYKV